MLLLEEPELSLKLRHCSKVASADVQDSERKRNARYSLVLTVPIFCPTRKLGARVLLLTPSEEGTKVELASSIEEIRDLLEGGLTVADAALPRTVPSDILQLDLFE